MWRSLAETDRPARPVSGPLPGWAGSSSRPHLVMVMTVAGLSPLDYSVTLGAHCHHSPPLAVGSMGLFSGPKLVPKLPACVWGNVHVYKAAVAAGIFFAKILHKDWLCVDWRNTLGSTKSPLCNSTREYLTLFSTFARTHFLYILQVKYTNKKIPSLYWKTCDCHGARFTYMINTQRRYGKLITHFSTDIYVSITHRGNQEKV